eukprot:scpid94471/ scgid9428/ 
MYYDYEKYIIRKRLTATFVSAQYFLINGDFVVLSLVGLNIRAARSAEELVNSCRDVESAWVWTLNGNPHQVVKGFLLQTAPPVSFNAAHRTETSFDDSIADREEEKDLDQKP